MAGDARPPGQSGIESYPELPFTKEWGGLVRRARQDRGLSQDQLADEVGTEQATISYIETGKLSSSKAVTPLVNYLEIPWPRQYGGDELDERWLDAGRILRRVNEAGFRGLLAAAEAMIANAEQKPH